MARRVRRSVGIALAAALVLVGVSAAAPGDLDPSFDEDGIVTTSVAPGGGEDVASAVATYPGGKLVAAGACRCDQTPPYFRFALVRYEEDGSLDATFGEAGIVTTSIGRSSDTAAALLVHPDGRLVVAGKAATRHLGADFALARYHPDGTLDTTFAGDGTRMTDIGFYDQVRALVLQPDGKLVAAGGTETRSSSKGWFTLARYDEDGSLDTSFGGDGIVKTPMRGGGGAEALVLQEDGKLVATGLRGQPQAFVLVRYHPDGSLDTSFGSGGIVSTPVGNVRSSAQALVLQPDGRLVAAGMAMDNSVNTIFALARYHPDGSLDTTFGGDGMVTTSIGVNASARDLVLQTDGRLVAAGPSREHQRTDDFTLVRYESDGSLDTTFGGDGIVRTSIGSGTDIAHALALDENGRLVSAGYADDPSIPYDFALARYSG